MTLAAVGLFGTATVGRFFGPVMILGPPLRRGETAAPLRDLVVSR